jgi:Tetratricopeptide repeat
LRQGGYGLLDGRRNTLLRPTIYAHIAGEHKVIRHKKDPNWSHGRADSENDPPSWPLCEQLTPHVFALRKQMSALREQWAALRRPWLERPGDAASQMAEWMADWSKLSAWAFRYDFGPRPKSQIFLERQLARYEKTLGPEHPGTTQCLTELAVLHCKQGSLAEARPLIERALAIREKAFGPEHPKMANSLSGLAMQRFRPSRSSA